MQSNSRHCNSGTRYHSSFLVEIDQNVLRVISKSLNDFDVLGHLGEVVSLNEVSGYVTGRCTVDTGGNVMPRHAGIRVSVQLVWREEGKPR